MTKHKGDKAGTPKHPLPHFVVKRISEGSFILVLTAALFVLLSLATHHVTGRLPLYSSSLGNAGGKVGAYLADGLYGFLGYFAYALPLYFVYASWLLLKDRWMDGVVSKSILLLRGVGCLLMTTGACGLLSFMLSAKSSVMIRSAGGLLGQSVTVILNSALNIQGAILLLLSMVLVGVTWLTGLSWIYVTEVIGCYSLRALYVMLRALRMFARMLVWAITRWSHSFSPDVVNTSARSVDALPLKRERNVPFISPLVVAEKARLGKIPPARAVKEPPVFKAPVTGDLPSLTLLDKGQPGAPMGGYTHQDLEMMSRDVEQHLLDFGIQVDVVSVHPGPVITRFELQLAAGVKVSRLTALAKDLARSLSVTSVRVVEIIPGKTVVGIELPNQNRAMVCLSDVLSADVYQQAHSPLTLALGVDIAGHPMVVDLAKMPHLLVAGTTGSGKSVGINAMILSLLFKASPEQVRLIMVDPKMLELSVYDGIPHLLTPVVTDMKEAASALRWCVEEMERRYRLMASLGVRNLAGFNTKVSEASALGQPLRDPLWKPIDSTDIEAPLLQSLPYVVVVIDELADMMMVVGKKVEQLIARIAQKARAAGIHLILATQRPSVDVLTGLIKSNIPTRISFQVSSKIDSRTILDQQGAEQLLGHGDMLFLAPGTGAPLRVHGAFVDDKEVHRIADDWRARGAPEYIDEITQSMGDTDGVNGEDGQAIEEADPLYDQAVAFVIQTRKASISAVQRRFKIGYNRAARLVEEMERTGVVGPMDGGFRDVLVSSLVENGE